MLILQSKKIITPKGIISGYLVIEQGVIRTVQAGSYKGNEELLDVGENYLSPGFIDMHTHGGGGYDFMDGTIECIIEAAKCHLKHGTTGIVPTTLTCTEDELFAMIDHYKEAKRRMENGPELLGLHLEGPYFNQAQCGAQDPAYIKTPDPEEYQRIMTYADGAIIRWSVAAELPGALEMGDFLRKNGVVASIGHSNAEYSQVAAAFQHGYSLLTHFYCAMSTIVRRGGFRHLGVIESGYAIEDLDVEIIADGCHLPPELLRMIYRLKGPDKIALVTDSMRGAGMPDGESILGSLRNGQKVLIEDGVAKLMDKSAFAGSTATTDRLVRVMYHQAGIDLCDAVKMMTATPARILGIADKKGAISSGMDADLVVFDEDIHVKNVFVAGRQVFSP